MADSWNPGGMVIWTDADARGYTVQMKETTWLKKIISTPGREFLSNQSPALRHAVRTAPYIYEDRSRKNRENYVNLALLVMTDGTSPVPFPVTIVVDVIAPQVRDIVTIFPVRKIDKENHGRLIYGPQL